MPNLSTDGFVVVHATHGYLITHDTPADIETHFDRDAVGVLKAVDGPHAVVHLIGRNEYFRVAASDVSPLNTLRTGKGFPKKICNVCHVLKGHSKFDVNQTDAHGRKTSRPSCKLCRQDIDRRTIKGKDKRKAELQRPTKGTLWRCPICQKRSIVGVTANVVLDHDHAEGRTRAFLCDSCNTGLGRFKNGENYLLNAIAYLKSFERS